MQYTGNQRVRAAALATVEPLEGRQLFAATLGGAQGAGEYATVGVLAAAALQQPSVRTISPSTNEAGVLRDRFVSAELTVPNGGVDASTVSAATVKLYRQSDNAPVAATVNTSAAGDILVLRPVTLLDANTAYTFEVTNGLKDQSGTPFAGFASTFTTGTASSATDPSVRFEKVTLSNAPAKQYTCLTMGPDGKLYAATITGEILRFGINADGTLGAAQTITSLQTASGGQRFLTGIAFAPTSTADNLVLFASHGYPGETGAPDFTGTITRLSGPNLENVQDFVTGLPRSTGDHTTNQLKFGPDGALYLSQGGNTAMGAPDAAWGNRPERLLSAAILRLDTAAVAARVAGGLGALNVTTADGGGTYDPYAAAAPLTIYATGVRNAYDLVWHSNGSLYAPSNGSQSGGNTPAGGGAVALVGVPQTENDWLFRVQPGGYYGHPNPVRNEFVFNGGNPTAGLDPQEITAYPVGTQPDARWKPAAFDLGQHVSPNGAIEYRGNAFGGRLAGKMLVARFSGGDDVVALSVGPDGSVVEQAGVTGLTNFVDPLDLIEDTRSGFLYVAEYGGQRITLARPVDPKLALGASALTFNDPVGGAVSPVQKLTVRNTGTTPLTIPAGGLSIAGPHAALFQLLISPALPTTIQPGASLDVPVVFSPGAGEDTGVKTATLRVLSNDAAAAQVDVPLRGLATAGTGGANEPSLQRILDLYGIPVKTGDVDPATAALTVGDDVLAPSDEVGAQRLQKAGDGPVTIEPLAVFANSATPTVKLGYYTPGSASKKTDLLQIASSESQTVSPTALGSTSFDPGAAAFGFYTVWPSFTNPDGTLREVFSEDALNVHESVAADRHKVRFYPLKDAAGAVVPNAFVMAFEEFVNSGTRSYDVQDFVAIVRNVKVASAARAPEIGLENRDSGTMPEWMTFNRIKTPDPLIPNKVHETGTLRVRNTGDAPLVVSALSMSNTNFSVVNPPSYPLTIPAGGFYDVTVKFISTSTDIVRTGTLNVASNDADEPALAVRLKGLYQSQSENDREPSLDQLRDMLGYATAFTSTGQSVNGGGRVQAVGDEVLSPYWSAAEPGLPVTVRQLAAYHGQGDVARIGTFAKGSWDLTTLFAHQGADSQSVLPRGFDGQQFGSFAPGAGAVFGFQVDGESSDDTRNVQEQPGGGFGHHLRFYPAKDSAGNVIPNTFLLVMDYSGINYDYNDNVYVITNIRPELAPAAPFGLAGVGRPNVGVMLDWADAADAGVTGYNVYRSTSPSGAFTKLNGAALVGSAFTDVTAAAGGTYYYRVTAVNAAGAESQPAQASAVGPQNAAPLPPAAPANVTTTATATQVFLSWADVANEAGYRVDRSDNNGATWAQVALLNAGQTSYTANGLAGGATYAFRVRAYNAAGDSAWSEVATATTVSTALPAGWTSADLGDAAYGPTPGTATHTDGTYTITAAGSDIYGAADGFRFAYQTLSGDVTLVARVVGLTNTDPFAKAGVMVRESLAAGARNVVMEQTYARSPQFQYRAAAGGQTDYTVQPGEITGTYWVKLVRAGDAFTGYSSPDGVTWTVVGSATVSMGSTVLVGLAVTSHNFAAMNTATFDNVSLTATAAGPAQTPFGTAPISVPGLIEAEDFDHGGEGVAYHDLTGGNSGGAYRPAGDVDVEPTTDVGGGYNIGSVRAGEWLEYTITVPAAGNYALDLRAAADWGYGGTFHVEFDGVDKTGALAFPATGGWQAWQTVSTTVTLAAGTQVMRLSLDAANIGQAGDVGNVNWLKLTALDSPHPAAPTGLTAAANASSTEVALAWADAANNEQGYHVERSTDGGVTFTLIATTGAGATGFLDGGRSPATTYHYRVRAYNANGASDYSNTAAATTAAAANAAPTVATAAGASATTVTGKTTTLSALGADDAGEATLKYTWSVVSAPAGAALPTFAVNGTNLAKTSKATFSSAGAYTFRVTIADAQGLTTTSEVSITVKQTATTVSVSPGSTTVNTGGSRQFTATVKDQFAKAMTGVLTTWSVRSGGAGTIASTGLYKAPATGTGTATVRAFAGGLTADATVTVQAIPASPIRINFQPGGAATVSGYLVDGGNTYGSRNGQSYGWSTSHTDTVKDRNANASQLLDTLVQVKAGATWEISLPGGTYSVKVSVGDATNASTNTLNVESQTAFAAAANGANVFQTKTLVVNVVDGRLTLDAGAAPDKATRLNYIEITPVASV